MRRRCSKMNFCLTQPTFKILKPSLNIIRIKVEPNPNLIKTWDPRTRTVRSTVLLNSINLEIMIHVVTGLKIFETSWNFNRNSGPWITDFVTQTLPIFFSDSLIGNHVTPEKETKVQKLKKDGASEFKKIKISDSQYVFTMGQIEKAEEKLNNFIKGLPTHFLGKGVGGNNT